MLERAGLISRSKSAQWRSSTLQVGPLKEVTDWMAPYRKFWDVNFDRLDAHLRRMQEPAHAVGAPAAGATRKEPTDEHA